MKRNRRKNVNPRRQPKQKRYPENSRVLEHQKIVEAAGARYDCSNAMDCNLVQFTSLQSGSTLCINQKLLTVENVRQHLIESNKKFGLETP